MHTPETHHETKRAATGTATPSFGKNLARRVVTAAVALPLLVAALFLGPPLLGVLVVALAALLGLHEFHSLLEARDIKPFKFTGTAVTLLFFVAAAQPQLLRGSVGPLAALLLLTAALARSGNIPRAVPAAAATLLGALYLGTLGGAMAGLLLLPPAGAGPWRLSFLLAVIMVSDVAAFFSGSAFGKHRLAPRLSPNKSVEGALGGLVAGVLTAEALREWVGPGLGTGTAGLLGSAVTVCGMAGDLVESFFKRWAGVKDSGALFPGHGGMLDRLDSLLFAAPVVYYFVIFKGF